MTLAIDGPTRRTDMTKPIILTLCLLAAACGPSKPDAVGAPPAQVDAAATADATTPTVRARDVIGTWRGKAGANRLEMTFDGDGSTFMQVKGANGVVDEAIGEWAISGGQPNGTVTGGKRDLAPYIRWHADTLSNKAMVVTGVEGATVTVHRS